MKYKIECPQCKKIHYIKLEVPTNKSTIICFNCKNEILIPNRFKIKHDFKPLEFKKSNYYVIEVKLYESNSKHRTIVKYNGNNLLEFIDYEERTVKNIYEIYDLKIISRINDMVRI